MNYLTKPAAFRELTKVESDENGMNPAKQERKGRCKRDREREKARARGPNVNTMAVKAG